MLLSSIVFWFGELYKYLRKINSHILSIGKIYEGLIGVDKGRRTGSF
jgi:hypothetical protein